MPILVLLVKNVLIY